jgi:hypothetical protein
MTIAVAAALFAGVGLADASDVGPMATADADLVAGQDGAISGLSFDFGSLGTPAAMTEGESAMTGGYDGLFGAGDGHDETTFGGNDGAAAGTETSPEVVPTPSAALLGSAGLAGLAARRRRR